MIELGTKASRGTVGLEPNGDLAAVPSSFSWRGTCPARSQCAENAPRAGVDSAAARGHCGSTHRRAGLRSRKEREPIEGKRRVLFRTALAMPAERCRECTEHTLRAATSVPNPPADLPYPLPPRRCASSQVPTGAHEKARSHGCHSDRPRDERNDGRGDTRTRMRERMHGAAPTAPPTCAKVSEECVSARARGVAHPLCSSSVSL